MARQFTEHQKTLMREVFDAEVLITLASVRIKKVFNTKPFNESLHKHLVKVVQHNEGVKLNNMRKLSGSMNQEAVLELYNTIITITNVGEVEQKLLIEKHLGESLSIDEYLEKYGEGVVSEKH